MHPNPAFRDNDVSRDIRFLRQRAFGTLAINGPMLPLTTHIPFLVNDAGSEVDLHLVRSNPIIAALKSENRAVITCVGPDGYVSPDWYDTADQVPTWNYVAVRLEGTLEILPQDHLRGVLDRLTEHFEASLDKPPWTSAKMSPGVMERMMRMIVPIRLTVSNLDSTWKLGQNKDPAARISASRHLVEGHGHELPALSRLMNAAE